MNVTFSFSGRRREVFQGEGLHGDRMRHHFPTCPILLETEICSIYFLLLSTIQNAEDACDRRFRQEWKEG